MEEKESLISRSMFFCFEKFMYFLVRFLYHPKVSFEDGVEREIKLDGPTVIVSNHISHVDGTVVSYLFRKYRPHNLAAKDRFEQGGFVGWYLTKAKCIPIDRKTLSTDWVRISVKTLTVDKQSIAIYPEGRHGHNREILPFHSGVTTIAAMTSCPLVMVYIDGPYRFGKRCRIMISNPFHLDPPTEGMTADYIGEQTEKLHEGMLRLQGELIAKL